MTSYTITAESPPRDATLITPDDDNDLATIARGLYIGTGGDVWVIMVDGSSAVPFHNVPTGGYVIGIIRRVMDTDTTADQILALHD